MNEKDKEAFEKWMAFEDRHDGVFGNNNNFTRDSWIAERAWQAACEYKQKEIDDLNDLVFAIETNNKSMEEQIEYLQAENAKLIEQDQIISQEIKTYIDIANRLQAENVKLKEYLEQISVMVNDERWYDIEHALKKLENK